MKNRIYTLILIIFSNITFISAADVVVTNFEERDTALCSINRTDGTWWDGGSPGTYLFDNIVLSDNVSQGSFGGTITIDTTQKYQTIMGFGASDAWLTQPVGKEWSTTVKEKIANWLFDMSTNENGSPQGIGLSMWRFNLGAGSFEQGDESQISDKGNRTECFLDPFGSGSYDWTKQSGQQYFLDKAKESGVENFVLFANSPPVSLTANGKAWRSKNSSDYNLRNLDYAAFSDFITNVVSWFKSEKNISFRYISPVNEPQYDWTVSGDPPVASQEGTSCKNYQFKGLIKALDTSLDTKQLNSKVLISEAAAWGYLDGDFNPDVTPTAQTLNWIIFFINHPVEICSI